MAEPVDRVMASQRGVGAVTLSKEAAMVLAMNDAAAHRGNGMFFYLPDTENASNGSSRVLEVRSIVPNLLYVQHSWDETECRTFKQLGEAGRYLFTQGKLPQLGNIDIVPIHLVVHSPFVEAFSWPMNNIATIAIYQRDSRFRLSLMADWARIAVVFVRSNGLNGMGALEKMT